MAGFFGADVEQLNQLGHELNHEAEQLDALTLRLTSRIASVAWHGPDAQKFTSEWHDRLAVSLRATAGALRDASGQAAANARQQVEASGGTGAGFLPVTPDGISFGGRA